MCGQAPPRLHPARYPGPAKRPAGKEQQIKTHVYPQTVSSRSTLVKSLFTTLVEAERGSHDALLVFRMRLSRALIEGRCRVSKHRNDPDREENRQSHPKGHYQQQRLSNRRAFPIHPSGEARNANLLFRSAYSRSTFRARERSGAGKTGRVYESGKESTTAGTVCQ